MKKIHKDLFMYSLAGFTMLLLFVLLYIMVFVSIPPENEKLLYMAFGTVLGWGSIIVGYFFSSSLGSARKEEILNQQRNLVPPDDNITTIKP